MIVDFEYFSKRPTAQKPQNLIPKHNRIPQFDNRVAVLIGKVFIFVDPSFANIKNLVHFCLILFIGSKLYIRGNVGLLSSQQVPRLFVYGFYFILGTEGFCFLFCMDTDAIIAHFEGFLH